MTSHITRARAAVTLAAASAIAAAVIAAQAWAQEGSAAPQLVRTITVTGQADVKARPDMAMISAGVTSEGATAAEALSKNSEAMAAVIKALRDGGVAEEDIQTSNFSVSPTYTPYDPNNPAAPQKIVGYQVQNSVNVAVRDLNKLGALLDVVVTSGANSIGGIGFSIAEPKPLLDRAREDAVKDARSRADLYAAAAGVGVGKVLTISETGFTPPQPVFYAKSMMAEAAPVPIAPGQETISGSITVTFEIQ